MKQFDEYKFANLDESESSRLSHLEDKIKMDTGKDIVLIAYEEKR